MELSFSLLFAAFVGFGHAFEPDHLVAVGNIVTKRNKLKLAITDGVYWGLGHTSTIFLIGFLMIACKSTFINGYFGYLEAIVGLMLILLGIYRLYKYYEEKQQDPIRQNQLNPKLTSYKLDEGILDESNLNKKHHLAYGVGLIHGLAGSGAMILVVMAEVSGVINSLLYLLIFGLGSIGGMMLAAGIFSLPFSKRISKNDKVYSGLVLLSSLICIGFGVYVILTNLS